MSFLELVMMLCRYCIVFDSVEHAYRQSMPDSYGVGMGMMGGMSGGMGINNMPGSQSLYYGRGLGYGVVSVIPSDEALSDDIDDKPWYT